MTVRFARDLAGIERVASWPALRCAGPARKIRLEIGREPATFRAPYKGGRVHCDIVDVRSRQRRLGELLRTVQTRSRHVRMSGPCFSVRTRRADGSFPVGETLTG